MGNVEEPALFTLDSEGAELYLAKLFSGPSERSRYRAPVGAALMLADAATQKASLEALDKMGDGSTKAPPSMAIECVERLLRLYLDGKPPTLDLVLWDREGYIHGWPLNQHGQADAAQGSFPETVRTLAEALRSLAAALPDWRELLERYAATLDRLLNESRRYAEEIARQRAASQGWLRKLRKSGTVAAQLISLGFTDFH
jgi:hypothetical protein